MFSELEIIEGTFIKESKNRFLCEVLVDGTIEECYVPSSSRIDNYLKLNKKKVLLSRNIGKNVRTKYSLFAVYYYNKFILLNLNKVNDILIQYLSETVLDEKQIYTIKKEEFINGYKSDLVIKEFNNPLGKIIEAKGIIDIRKEIHFPKVHSDRALKQLMNIKTLLKNHYDVEYYFVSLSPIVKKVNITSLTPEYFKILCECLNSGLKIKGISINIDRKMNIEFNKLNININ